RRARSVATGGFGRGLSRAEGRTPKDANLVGQGDSGARVRAACLRVIEMNLFTGACMPLGFHPASVERVEAGAYTDPAGADRYRARGLDGYFGRGGDCRPDGHGLTPSDWFHAFAAFQIGVRRQAMRLSAFDGSASMAAVGR